MAKEDHRYRQLAFEARWAREKAEFEGLPSAYHLVILLTIILSKPYVLSLGFFQLWNSRKILDDLRSRPDAESHLSSPVLANFDKYFLADQYDIMKKAEYEVIRKRDEKGGLKKMDRPTLNFSESNGGSKHSS